MRKHGVRDNRARQDETEAALNIRNFPADLLWKCREQAAQRRMTLRNFVIETLQTATSVGGE
jgi:hypothetical protein